MYLGVCTTMSSYRGKNEVYRGEKETSYHMVYVMAIYSITILKLQ